MKVLAISGSLRQNSWNRKLLRLASEVLKKHGAVVEDLTSRPYPFTTVIPRQWDCRILPGPYETLSRMPPP